MEVRHFNQHQLARRWGVKVGTLQHWRGIGKGPAYLKIGGRVVYRLEDIEAYEAANTHADKASTSK